MREGKGRRRNKAVWPYKHSHLIQTKKRSYPKQVIMQTVQMANSSTMRPSSDMKSMPIIQPWSSTTSSCKKGMILTLQDSKCPGLHSPSSIIAQDNSLDFTANGEPHHFLNNVGCVACIQVINLFHNQHKCMYSLGIAE